MNYSSIIFMAINFLRLEKHIYRTMVVTVFDDEIELSELFESTEDQASDYCLDPLEKMDMADRAALWEKILSSTYFTDKNVQNPFPVKSSPQETVASKNESSVELLKDSSKAAPYSYEPRAIHCGDKKRTQKTVLCVAEMISRYVRNEYHISYAYRRNSYFISRYVSSKNQIILIGIAEPRGERQPYDSQEKLEESFRAQISIANQLNLRRTSPTNSPTKGQSWGIRKLKITQKVRLCGQVFDSKYYQDEGLNFAGSSRNVKEINAPMLISFKSERFQENEIYENMFGCVVKHQEEMRTFYISNSYDINNEQVAVFVLAYDEKNYKQYLDSHITAVTVLMPSVCESIRHLVLSNS